MKKALITAAILLMGSCVLADAIPDTTTPIIRTCPHPDLGHVTAGTDYLAETAHLVPQPVYNTMPPMYNIYGGLRGYGPITPAFGSCITNPYGGYSGMYLGHH